MSEINTNSQDNTNLSSDLVKEILKERRRDRRWKNIRFFLGLMVVILIVLLVVGSTAPNDLDEHGSYVSLVRLDGMIGPGEDFSAEHVIPLLKKAFKDSSAKGVILDINSGGGTPVQSSIIHDEIIRLKNKYHKKVIVVGEDTLASGAYYVASSADKIYVNPNTTTGSIGVIMRDFGFVDAIKKVGVDRRVIASGVNKDRLDPFLPQSPEDVAKVHDLLQEVLNNFVEVVKQGRQGKLHGDPKELFSGDFWTGQTALKLGLVDGLGNLSDVMQTEFNVSRFKDYSESPSILKNIIGQVGESLDLPVNRERLQTLEKL